MSRRLLLLRHAKSSWDDPSLPDRERPLSPRGRRNAAAVAQHLAAAHLSPALVLCSSSLRTRETLAALLPVLDGEVVVRIDSRLYDATAADLLELLRGLPDEAASVLVIGHNPALEELVARLAGAAAPERFPTGALATIETGTGWAELGAVGTRLAEVCVPR